MSGLILHFSLGPVQSFVGQARRTRDLWAGSFLLAFLAGQSMKAVLDGGGKLLRPGEGQAGQVEDDLLKAIMGKSKLPMIGSLPNQFKAWVPDGFKAEACRDAVNEAFGKVAEAVWNEYVDSAEPYGKDTRKIWQDQVNHYWEMSWVLVPVAREAETGSLLAARKNWRSDVPPFDVDSADHCVLMPELQEISGYIRSHHRKEQNAFWEKVRAKVGELNLDEYERLSAIALIKRLYPLVANEALGMDFKGGQGSVTSWPSTSYLAASSWLAEHKNDQAFRNAGQIYYNHVLGVDRNVANQSRGVNLGLDVGPVAWLDGNLFYRSAIQNPRMFEFKNGQRRELVAALGELYQAAGGPPGNFYALLMTDGDSLGKVLGAYDEGAVSAALRKFANEAKGIIAEHHGVAVYLGGDDVLALLPMSTALAAATELRKLYQEKFENLTLKKDKEAVKTSISGALVFANRNLSLRAVYRQAHDLLDDVAKDGNGRDSLAVTVLRPGGVSLQWVSAWDEPGARQPVPLILIDLAADFQNQLYSTGFFYKIRERFAILANEDGELYDKSSGALTLPLLTAEYLKTRDPSAEAKPSRLEAEERVGKLLRVCRKREGGKSEAADTLIPDGALLVRFLANRGVEE